MKFILSGLLALLVNPTLQAFVSSTPSYTSLGQSVFTTDESPPVAKWSQDGKDFVQEAGSTCEPLSDTITENILEFNET